MRFWAVSKTFLFFSLLTFGCGNGQVQPGDSDVSGGDHDEIVGDTVGGDLDGQGDQDPYLPLACDRTLEPAADGICTLQRGSDALIVRGDLVLPNGIMEAGEILIDAAGAITCVDCDCSYRPEATGATELTCAHGIISPGLINPHDHITFTEASPVYHGNERYEHRHEWRKGLNGGTRLSVYSNSHSLSDAWGEARQVLGGTTSLIGVGGNEGFLRNLDKDHLLEGLAHAGVDAPTFPLGDQDGSMYASGCDEYFIDHASDAMSHPAYVAHVAEGLIAHARNELVCISGEAAGSEDLLFDTSAIVHGIGVSAADIALMAGEGTGLVWSPRTNTDLYGVTAPVPVYDRLGVMIALGTDWTATGSINLLRELRCAEQWNGDYWGYHFSEKELVSMVTDAAAELSGFGDLLGALTVGKVGDVAIWDASQHAGYRAILDAEVSDVVLVLRGGTALYGDAEVVAGLTAGGDCEPLTVCGRGKSICALREIGTTIASLQNDLPNDIYDLFFCGEPTDEPSCLPFRPDEFDGQPTATDHDGDGVLNANDNCPEIFNPPVALDGNVQADADGDLTGDLCDPCPLNADTTACSSIDPEDRDGDSVSNASDNCPSHANPLQEDGDQDGIGDACDTCAAPNPGGAPCPSTIYDVKNGQIANGAAVVIDRAVVTANDADEFWMTMEPGDPAYDGPDYASIVVYDVAGDHPPAGARVRVSGTVGDFFGRIEIVDPTVTVLEPEAGVPTHTLVEPAAIVTGGGRAEALEGGLVQVLDVEVVSTTSPGMAIETVENEFLIDDNLPVNDLLYRIDPQPPLGQRFTVLTGILVYSYARNKLEPRGAADVVTGAPTLASFGPEPVYIYAGDSGSTSPPLIATFGMPLINDYLLPVTSADSDAVEVLSGGASFSVGDAEGEVFLFAHTIGGPVELTATFGDISLTSNVIVLDPAQEPAPVTLTLEAPTVVVGQSVEATVTLDIPAQADGQDVTIGVSSVSGGATVNAPTSVHVPAGAYGTAFTVTADQTTGEVELTATIGATSVSADLEVSSFSSVGLVMVEVMYNPSSTDGNAEWVRLYNGTPQPIDLNDWSLGWGGASYVEGTMQLSGSIGAFACLVVGGPDSNENNGNPAIDLIQDFNPDIQNATSEAGDAIGLFDQKATFLTAGTVPMDAVVWGASNATGFVGPDGEVFPDAHVAKGPSGNSIIRTSLATWADNPTPASEDCILITE